jgi:hypothetical protein
MTMPSTDQLFREAAIAEGGMPISAGARVAHVRLALESGRAITVDLSQVPKDRRSSLVSVIREMVKLAEAEVGRSEVPSASAKS